jgi:hypothetical protein
MSTIRITTELEEARRIKRKRLVVIITTPVLLETYNLILQRSYAAAAHAWLMDTSEESFLSPRAEDDHRAVGRIQGNDDQRIPLNCAVIDELGDSFEMPVCTFDRHFDVMHVQVWR